MTTSTPLSCDAFAGSLMDYLEHDASVALRGAMDTHAASCASCASLLAGLRAIAGDAAQLPPLEPSRDLWAGIAARIETPVVELKAAAPRALAPRHWRRGLVAAGLVAVAAGSWTLAARTGTDRGAPAVASPGEPGTGVPLVASRGTAVGTTPASGAGAEPEPMPATSATSATSVVTPSAATTARPAVRRVSRNASARLANAGPASEYRAGAWRAVDSIYGAEIGRLRRLAAENRKLLDPATVAVLEKNIRIIDQAIMESRAAIARDPNSALLNDQVNRMLDQKVELLRAISTLPARS